MTVYKEHKITQKLINNHNRMNEHNDQDQSMITEDSQSQDTSTGVYGPLIDCNVENITSYTQSSDSLTATYLNVRHPNDFEPFSRYFLGEWSGVEHIYRLAVQPERELNWSQSPPSPPPPMAFGINNDLMVEETFEEENLINAFDNIVLSHPNLSSDPRNEVENLQHDPVNNYTFKPVLGVSTYAPKAQDLIRKPEDLFGREPCSTAESISSYAP